MKGYSYIVARDYGFAPNPFDNYCTLATCKPIIRKHSDIGDIIFGISPKSSGNKLIYAMKVSDKMTFNEYWNHPQFQSKKPVLNGSRKTKFGDNIYYFDSVTNQWFQADSHHSNENGVVNELNLKRDTKTTNFVLIANDFFYFGAKQVEIPDKFKSTLTKWNTGTILGVSQKEINEIESLSVWKWLTKEYHFGIHGFPSLFGKGFERYDGK